MPLRKALCLISLILIFFCNSSFAATGDGSSVLASGTWRKISVSESGIFHLSRAALNQMGFTDPSKVRVYGAGGQQKSFVVGRDTRDDLYLLPAIHTSDGLLFYAQGPTAWSFSGSYYSPNFNAYSRKAYYYLTTGDEDDSPETLSVDSDDYDADEINEISTFDNRFMYAPRTINISSTGRTWFSDKMSGSNNKVTIPVDLASVEGETVFISGQLASQVSSGVNVSVSLDGNDALSLTTSAVSGSLVLSTSMSFSRRTIEAPSSRISSATVSIDGSPSSPVYLGFLQVVVKAPLEMSGSEFLFRNSQQCNSDYYLSHYSIDNVPADVVVWDVTTPWTPAQCEVSVSGGKASFFSSYKSVREYVAFSPSGSFASPTDEGAVANQNLHADGSVNYLIVTAPKFASYAERIANLHSAKDGLSTRIVYVDDIYNEFSAGRAEAPAIRDYIKMVYDRGAGTADELKFVLLFGAGNYDNFDRTKERNVIPTYQSENSYHLINSYSTDDFYGWLEKGEGQTEIRGTMEIGVGRIPCTYTYQAENYVSKVESFVNEHVQGNWQARAIFVGQSGDSNEHQGYARDQAAAFEEENPDMDVVRIFSEAYTRQVASTGSTYPQAVSTLHNYLQTGCSLFHFTGHGGATGTGNNFLSQTYASTLTNGTKAFLFVAATCAINSYDIDAETTSSDLLFNANGGAIAVFAATRETYGAPNYVITRAFNKYAYSLDEDGNRITLGEAEHLAKTSSSATVNSLKYALIGDPALKVSTPAGLFAQLDSVNGVPIDEVVSPVRALEHSHVSCSIRLADGSVDESFNGSAIVSIYDKRVTKQTSGVESGASMTYDENGARVFSGEVEVVNGHFTVSFILPKEFDLTVGYGRLTAYASGADGRDALGSSDALLLGGFADEDAVDDNGPEIKAWVDYERDANGNVISNTPILYAIIADEQGINVSGQGVGHDISLVVDGDRTSAISLNNYFSYEAGSYTSGLVSYPLSSLSTTDEYSLTIKAWDNLNNSSSVTLPVNLNRSGSMAFGGRAWYSDGHVVLAFESNMPVASFKVRTSVYSLMGRLVSHNEQVVDQRNGGGRELTRLSTGALASGIYIVHCEAEADGHSFSFSRKIFVKAQ